MCPIWPKISRETLSSMLAANSMFAFEAPPQGPPALASVSLRAKHVSKMIHNWQGVRLHMLTKRSTFVLKTRLRRRACLLMCLKLPKNGVKEPGKRLETGVMLVFRSTLGYRVCNRRQVEPSGHARKTGGIRGTSEKFWSRQGMPVNRGTSGNRRSVRQKVGPSVKLREAAGET